MGKLGVEVDLDDTGAGRSSAGVEPMTQAQGSALLGHVLEVAGARVLLGAKVVVFDALDVPDLLVFEDGRRFWLGGEVEREDRGDRIVEASRGRGDWGRPAPAGARLDGPPFTYRGPEVIEPRDGMLDRLVEGPWGPYQVEADAWQPWNALEQGFEQQTFTGEHAERRCQERCWFLNSLVDPATELAGPGMVTGLDRLQRERNAEREAYGERESRELAGDPEFEAERERLRGTKSPREADEIAGVGVDRLAAINVSGRRARETDQQRYAEPEGEDPGETRRRAALRQAVWEASQTMDLELIRAFVDGVLAEIASDTP